MAMQVNLASLIAAQALRPAAAPTASRAAALSNLKAVENTAPAPATSPANAASRDVQTGPARIQLGAKIDIRV
jgi:hypothetical protein